MSDNKSTSKSKRRELYLRSQRLLVATLLSHPEETTRVLELVGENDIEEPNLAIVFSAIAELSRRNVGINPLSVAEILEQRGLLRKAGDVAQLYTLYKEGSNFRLQANAELFARLVKEASAKAKISRKMEEKLEDFKDDSGVQAVDAVSELQAALNDELLVLSDDATITHLNKEFDEYEQLLKERKAIADENSGQADGLTGIPTLLPHINKWTRGWSPGQLVTVGAGTGVGKALDIRTPILTNTGFKTMEELKVGDKVYGRDGKLTTITNVTEVMHNRPCFSLQFNTGERMTADAEHLWFVLGENGSETVLTTAEIMKDFEAGKTIRIIRTLPLAGVEQSNLSSMKLKGELLRWVYTKKIKIGSGSVTPLNLRRGILPEYLRAMPEHREQLARSISGEEVWDKAVAGEVVKVEFNDRSFASGFYTLLASLGARVQMVDSFTVSYALGDALSYALQVTSVHPVESTPVKCIAVDNADHSYLAGKALIPTHNSAFAINCAVAAAEANNSTMFFSLEMDKDEIHDRIFSSTTGIPLNQLKLGSLDDEQKRVLATRMNEMKGMKLTIDTEPKQTVDSIRARAMRQAQSPEGLDFIIVDYLQLVTATGNFSNRQEAVADISRNMKLLAKQLGVPIMVLVQMKRKKDSDDESSIPKLDDIRESGAIAQDSDVVILLHRDIALDETTPHTLVILAKQRGGVANRTVRCHSNLSCSIFREVPSAKNLEKKLEESDDIDLNDGYIGGDSTPNDVDLIDDDLDDSMLDEAFETEDLDNYDFDM